MATVTAIISLTGCLAGPGFLKQQGNASLINDSSKIDATVVSSQDGAITGAISGNSGDTQVLSAADGSGIDGASVLFPPGSLGVDANITVEEGATLASDVTAAELGLDNDLTAASGAVVVSADTDIEAINPFTIAITMSGSGLVEIDRTRVVIVFKVKKADGAYYTGVIPNSLLTFEGEQVKFETTNFGSFQAVTTAAVITEKKEVTATAPIVTKREEIALPEPKDFRIVKEESTIIRFAWASGGGNTAGFAMVFGNDSAPLSCLGAKMTGDLNKVDAMVDKLVPNKQYGFRLCSVDASGKQSAGVTVVGKTTPPPVNSAPGSFVIKSPTVAAGGVFVWTSDDFKIGFSRSSGATDYEAFFADDINCSNRSFTVPNSSIGTTFDASGTAFVDTDLVALTEGINFFCMSALNDQGRANAAPFKFELERSVVHVNYTKKVVVSGSPTNSNFSQIYARIKGPSKKILPVDAITGLSSDELMLGASSLTLNSNNDPIVSYEKRPVVSGVAGDRRLQLKRIDEDGAGNLSVTNLDSTLGFTSMHYEASSVTTLADGSIALSFYKRPAGGGSKYVVDYRPDSTPPGPSSTIENWTASTLDVPSLEAAVNTNVVHTVYQTRDSSSNNSVIYHETSSSYALTFAPTATLFGLGGDMTYCNAASRFAPTIAVSDTRAAFGFVCKMGSTCTLIIDVRDASGGSIGAEGAGGAFYVNRPIASSANCFEDVQSAQFLKPSLAFDSAGHLHVAYANRVTSSTLGELRHFTVAPGPLLGGSVSPDTVISAANVVGAAKLAVDEEGHDYIFWLENVAGVSKLMMTNNNVRPFSDGLLPPKTVDTDVIGLGSAAINGVPGRSEWP